MVDLINTREFTCQVNGHEAMLVGIWRTEKASGIIFDPVEKGGNVRGGDDNDGDFATVLSLEEAQELREHLNKLIAAMV